MSTQAPDIVGDTAPVLVAAMQRRRVRRWLIGVASMLLILASAGYLITANTQQLEFEGFSGYNPADGVSVRKAGLTTEYRFPFRPNGTFTFYTSIRNPGPWPALVTDVSLNGWSTDYFVVERLLYRYDGDSIRAYGPEQALPWKPVSVAPNGALALFLTIKIPDIKMDPGGAVFWETFGVRYEVLGLAQEQRVPIGFFLSVGP